MAPSESVIVIGAGVLGLSTATLLQRKYPSTEITIIAAELPNTSSPSADYASMWAGAHYRPIPRSTRQLEDEAELGLATAKVMKSIAEESPEAGVEVVQGVEYLETPPPENLALKTGDVYAGPNDRFRVFDQSELPAGLAWGCEYEAWCINVPKYCMWLLNGFTAKGGKVVQHKLRDAADAYSFAEKIGLEDVRAVVNCSGRNFDQDPMMQIIRGQTVLVRQQYTRTVTRQNADGSWAFLIPRPQNGGTIVGGSKEIGDTETRARPETRQKLLEQTVAFFPDFVDSMDKFEVLRDNVGRRPWREGGLRIEAEQLSAKKLIVHGYGAGGRGYELSWGAAQRLVDLLDQQRSSASKL